MALFEKALKANVMSTHLLIRANVSKKILLEAHKIATDFEDRFSAYKEESFLNIINKDAGQTATPITPLDYELFQRALQVCQDTAGAFDISIGLLTHGTYHLGFKNETKPSPEMIKKRKRYVNHRDIVLADESILLKYEAMQLDLGGIGKGFVARQIARFLESHGATKILVDVGGEIVTRGKSYTIALKDPFGEGNIAYIKTSKADISISTSGSYERFIDEQNHHIINPYEGKSTHLYSSMTLLKNGWDIDQLDAYATAFFNQTQKTNIEYCTKRDISMITIDTKAVTSLFQTDKLNIDSITFTPLTHNQNIPL